MHVLLDAYRVSPSWRPTPTCTCTRRKRAVPDGGADRAQLERERRPRRPCALWSPYCAGVHDIGDQGEDAELLGPGGSPPRRCRLRGQCAGTECAVAEPSAPIASMRRSNRTGPSSPTPADHLLIEAGEPESATRRCLKRRRSAHQLVENRRARRPSRRRPADCRRRCLPRRRVRRLPRRRPAHHYRRQLPRRRRHHVPMSQPRQFRFAGGPSWTSSRASPTTSTSRRAARDSCCVGPSIYAVDAATGAPRSASGTPLSTGSIGVGSPKKPSTRAIRPDRASSVTTSRPSINVRPWLIMSHR